MNSDNHTDAAANLTGAQTRDYQERLERYGRDFLHVLHQESPPGAAMRQGLRQAQQSLGLTDQDVAAMEAKVSQDFQTQTLTYQEYLHHYEQEFSTAIQQEYPLSAASQNRLWLLQDQLGLQSQDVIKIEGQILSQKENAQPLPIDSLAAVPSFSSPVVAPQTTPQDPLQTPNPNDFWSPAPFEDELFVRSQDRSEDRSQNRLPESLRESLREESFDDPNFLTTPPPYSRFAEVSPTTGLPFSNFEPVATLPDTQLDKLSLDSERGIDYTYLHELLQEHQWEKADEETLAVMLQVSGRGQDGWLDAAAIANFPCTDLQTIDRLWGKYSDEQFSFRVQYRLYNTVEISTENAVSASRTREEQALALSKKVGWWTPRLEFLKYYNQLDFSPQAPDGHLPALWLWTIPWWQSIKYGGIGPGRGGCRVDPEIISAFISRLERCGFE
jgi:GUN4-like